MAEETGISWTNATFNIVWGCTKVSPACKNCYAETLAHRFEVGWGPNAARRVFDAKHWNNPVRWNKAAGKIGRNALVFCSSMCDVFEDHPTVIAELVKLWPLIRATPNLTWQLLTKRPERILGSLPADWGTGYPNVWIGATIENNDYVDRADHLRAVPAVCRFVSYEPACGPLDKLDLTGLHWLIFGGESGKDFRQHDPQWARDIKARCEAAGVTFFYKQGSSLKSGADPLLDGVEYKNFPIGYQFTPNPPKKKRPKKGTPLSLPVIS
jgi:protein gp37